MNLKINTNSKKIFCNGDNTISLGHPIIFLIINPITNTAFCPYCSTTYTYNKSE